MHCLLDRATLMYNYCIIYKAKKNEKIYTFFPMPPIYSEYDGRVTCVKKNGCQYYRARN